MKLPMSNIKSYFQTQRLGVVPANNSDIAKIIAMETDKDNADFVWSGTYEEHQLEIEDPSYELAIIQAHHTGTVVGFSLSKLDFHSMKYELKRIVITQKGQGYGREILSGFLKYVFETLNMNRFWLDVYPDNLVGMHLYESLGLCCEGVLRQHYKSERGYLDQIVYAMLREEYDQ